MMLSVPSHYCVVILDIDECKLESSLCDGECVNTEGSYYCECPSSFALASDGKTCVECGVNNLAINTANSGNVHRRKFSWHVQLCSNATNDNNSSFLCSGSLINDQWVLTSAECICGKDYSSTVVYLHKLAKCPATQTNEITRTISAVYCHRGYQNNKIIDYNMALLKLSSPVNNSDASPVCLPKSTTIKREFHESVNGVYVTGWGSLSHLHYSKLSTVPFTICKKSYAGGYDIEANSICTGKCRQPDQLPVLSFNLPCSLYVVKFPGAYLGGFPGVPETPKFLLCVRTNHR